MNLKNKKISVVGAARSGQAMLELLLEQGANIFVSDAGKEQKFVTELAASHPDAISYEFGENSSKIYEGRDMVILSPGVWITNPIVQEAIQAGVEVIGEAELSSRFVTSPIIAVTGTNGKSTTASLIHHALSHNGHTSLLAGNIGIPLTRDLADHVETPEYIVVEISSFQLESVSTFHPKVAIITNITDDHLDRHGSIENYAATKARIFENQTDADFAVLNYDDPLCRKIAENVPSNVSFFSTKEPVPNGRVCLNGQIRAYRDGVLIDSFERSQLPIAGDLNLKNSLAMLAVADVLNLDRKGVVRSLESFKTLHHRMELCGTIDGIKFYDDSKGTNPGAVIEAVRTAEKPLSLIIGGRNKRLDLDEMCKIIAQNVSFLAVIGESASLIAENVRKYGFTNIQDCGFDFKSAIVAAFNNSSAGGSVLLSPACTSFDMFANAEERGEKFQEIVTELAKK